MKPTHAQLSALARRDPVLGRALRRVPAFPGFPVRGNVRQSSHYHSLTSAIVYQQLSGKAAATIWGRLVALTPGKGFPKPEEVRGLSDEALRSCGLSAAKLRAIRDLCERIEAQSLPLARLSRMQDERVIEELIAVRGIGRWSAQMFLMFRLGRLDVMAEGDLGLQEGARLLDGQAERPKPAELLARSEIWRPLRSVASWTLWRLIECEREEKAASALRQRPSASTQKTSATSLRTKS